MALAERAEEILMTGEELLRRPDLEPCELVEGRIVPKSPTGPIHGSLEARLAARLLAWAESTGQGKVLVGEVGMYVRRNPDTVRAADVLLISYDRYARPGSAGYLNVAPELVVEILSPDDRWSDVMAKLADYFQAGVDRAWVVDGKLRRVFAYRSLAEVQPLGEGDVLMDEDLLPGFSLPLVDLFRD
jgi:Uma2 family endonuclease